MQLAFPETTDALMRIRISAVDALFFLADEAVGAVLRWRGQVQAQSALGVTCRIDSLSLVVVFRGSRSADLRVGPFQWTIRSRVHAPPSPLSCR